MKEKIIEMLGNNIPQGTVAKACGVTDSYISQLMSDEDVRAQVSALKVANIDRSIKVDNLIENIETKALERAEALLPFVSRPMDAMRIFQMANSAKKNKEVITGNVAPTAPLVQINISHEAAVAFKLSAQQEVIEVDGRSMATMPARTLLKNLKERQDARPALSDATTAEEMLQRIEQGIPQMSIAHVL